MLITGRKPPATSQSGGGDDEAAKNASFKPFQPFGTYLSNAWFYREHNLILGGFSSGTFSLSSLYSEHLYYRNRWSQSNCGFDLATYRGTKVYFQAHRDYDYLVFIDPEYRSFEEWIKQPLHPAVLLTHPQTRIIRSIRNGGPRRKMAKMFVPPPSTMNTGWQWMPEIAKEGLFAWFTCWIDLGSPWIGNVDNPNQVRWWSTGSTTEKPKWVVNSIAMQGKTVQEGLNTYYSWNSGKSVNPASETYHLGFGPFVFKGPHAGDSNLYPQMVWFYKSYWQWGGSTTSIKTVCDPKDNPNAQVTSPDVRQGYGLETSAHKNDMWVQS